MPIDWNEVQLREMWRRLRAILLSHAVASWIATPILWIYQFFLQRGLPPELMWSNVWRDPQFWLSFTVHEVAAPIFVPIILICLVFLTKRETDVIVNFAILSNAYVIVGVLFFAWWRRRQDAKLIDDRLKHGLCPGCGYDIRATPNQCPECGKQPKIQFNLK
jgi:hypothetical protein